MKRKKPKPFWERAYKGHAYWLGKMKLGKVTLLVDGEGRYRWEAAGRTGFVDALDKDAADYGARDGGVAKPPDHDLLDLRGGRVEHRVFDVVAGEDGPDLPAIGAPRRVVHDDAFAAPGLGLDPGKTKQRHCRSHDQRQVTNRECTSWHVYPDLRWSDLIFDLAKPWLFHWPICCT